MHRVLAPPQRVKASNDLDRFGSSQRAGMRDDGTVADKLSALGKEESPHPRTSAVSMASMKRLLQAAGFVSSREARVRTNLHRVRTLSMSGAQRTWLETQTG